MWTPDRIRTLTAGIPHEPGVYIMRDRAGTVVYVGKAIDLANRVSQYFHRSGDPRPFVGMLSGVLDRIDTVVTRNEKEALILENELIKKHRPPFNILLRDDKSFLYLRVDPSETYPRLELVRRRRPDGAHYFGPYHSAASIRGTHALVNRYFGLCTCTESQFRNRSRPCIEQQMGRCLGPCAGEDMREEYMRRVEAAVMFLRGRHEEVLRQLRGRMEAAAEAENFEEAARLRDQIRAVESAMTRQAVVLPTTRDTDAIGFAREGDVVAFAVLRFEAGVLSERIPYVLHGVLAPDDDVAPSFVVQYYGRAPIPDEVLLPQGLFDDAGALALAEVLAPRREGAAGGGVRENVQVRIPGRGPAADAVRMAHQNALNLLRESLVSGQARARAGARVAELLGLPRPPRRIDGFDMSTLFSAEPVGSMVVFVDGQPEKRSYRTFAVRLEEGPGDVGFMREVLRRRYSRAAPDERPDLVMLDGGEAQLRTAWAVMADLGLSGIPIVAIAKSRVVGRGNHGPAEHSPERLYVLDEAAQADGVRDGAGPLPARLIVPPQNDPGLHLLMRVRDEAHRFAVKFHRKRRARREIASVLDGIPGLGKTRRTALLRALGSVSAIRTATLDELRAVPGIPGPVAEAVYRKVQGLD